MAYAIVAVLVLILDQSVKYWTTLNIAVDGSRDFIPGFLELTNLHNTGAAYGLFNNVSVMRWIFVLLAVAFAALVIWLLAKKKISGAFGRWTLVLVLAGGIGNCIDRVLNGYVVDMFHFVTPDSVPVFNSGYPVFNVADMFISICGILFCLWLIFHKRPKEQPAPAQRGVPQQPRRAPSSRMYDYENEIPPERRMSSPSPAQQSSQPGQHRAPQRPAPAQRPQRQRRPVQDDEPTQVVRRGEATRGPDYMAQIDKPINEAKMALSSPDKYDELAAGKKDFFADLNGIQHRPADSAAAPAESARPAQPASQSEPKKPEDEFSLDAIIAEFKDK